RTHRSAHSVVPGAGTTECADRWVLLWQYAGTAHRADPAYGLLGRYRDLYADQHAWRPTVPTRHRANSLPYTLVVGARRLLQDWRTWFQWRHPGSCLR